MKLEEFVLLICCVIFFNPYLAYCEDSLPQNVFSVKISNLIKSIELDDAARNILTDKFDRLTETEKGEIDNVDYRILKKRFDKYVEAQKKVNQNGVINKEDVRNFDWSLLIHEDITWITVGIISADAVTIHSLVSGSVNIGNSEELNDDFSVILNPNEQKTIVLPSTGNTLKLAGHKATGDTVALKVFYDQSTKESAVSPYVFFSPSYTRGVKFDIKTKPKNAEVYFNEKKYYQKTNTSCVRKAGVWKVRIHLDGYKDWEETFKLQNGDTQSIDITLEEKL